MSAKIYRNIGGSKPIPFIDMTLNPRPARLKKSTRRMDRRSGRKHIAESVNESGDPRSVGREHGLIHFLKATASTIGVTGYTSNLTAYDGRLFLE